MVQILEKIYPKDQTNLVINGLGNGLVLNRRQAITWTNDDPFNWHIYAWSSLKEL